MIKELVNLFVPVFNHFFNVSVMYNANSSVVTIVDFIDYRFISLEESVVEQVQYFNLLERHFHDDFYFEPESSNHFEVIFTLVLLIVEKDIIEDDSSNIS